MKIIQKIGKEDLATVYIGETKSGRVEFVESVQPPLSRNEKWVLIISSLYGCPVKCQMCDAGGGYEGKLSTEEILEQIDHLVSQHYPDRRIPSKKFKIQFARVGEPSLNPNVLDALRIMLNRYDAPGLMPSISTIAPSGRDAFFDELLMIKNELYPNNFQLQFSIHSTDETERNKIIPIKKWSLEKIAEYGEKFYNRGQRKVTLNFILTEDYTIEPKVLYKHFSPDSFFIKMTPLNPTCKASTAGLRCMLNSNGYKVPTITKELKEAGYDVLLSIGELEENQIGSNCGQFIKTYEEYSERNKLTNKSYLFVSREQTRNNK